MIIDQLIEYEKYSEQLEIELHQKKLDWLNSHLSKKDEAVKTLIPPNPPAPSKYNNNSYFGKIVGVTDEMTNSKGNKMRWINVEPEGSKDQIGYCINLDEGFKGKNLKQLQILNIDVDNNTTIEELENMPLDNLIGKQVKFHINKDGKYIDTFSEITVEW